MKKRFTDSHYKHINKKHAKDSLARQLVSKAKKASRNRSHLGQTRSFTSKSRRVQDPYIDYVKIVAPENFTLIGNPEPVINFISKLENSFDKREKVWVVLNNVTKIDYNAIIVLLSIMVTFKSHGIKFNGDYPNDLAARNILIKSGFIKNLYRTFKEEDRYDIKLDNNNLIRTQAWKEVDSSLSSKIIEQASTTVWKKKQRCQGVQRTLIELMLNTNNHASFEKEGEKHWWLSVNHRINENKVTFSFVDYGVGVFKSLKNKPVGNKFYGAIERMMSKFKFTDNAELFKLILNGELHKTTTGEYYRGKGLPGIYEAFKRSSFSNLFIITNDVYVDVEREEYRNLNCNFNGTFLYWELDNTNISCNAND